MTDVSVASRVSGLLLTGGASRRMGRPKATVEVEGTTMVERTSSVLGAVCDHVLEIGPGYSAFTSIVEDPPGEGPLSAVVAGWRFLERPSRVLVLAVDMPFVTADLLRSLRDVEDDRTLVPTDGHRLQPLCARWSGDGLAVAEELFLSGTRSMMAAVQAIPHKVIDLAALGVHDKTSMLLADVDTPADLP